MPVSSKSDGLYSTLIGIKLTKPRFLQMAEERMQKATFTCLPQEKKISLDKMLFGLRISSNVLYIWLLFFVYRCSKALAVENKIRTRTCCLIEIRRKNQNILKKHIEFDLDLTWHRVDCFKKNGLVFRSYKKPRFCCRTAKKYYAKNSGSGGRAPGSSQPPLPKPKSAPAKPKAKGKGKPKKTIRTRRKWDLYIFWVYMGRRNPMCYNLDCWVSCNT